MPILEFECSLGHRSEKFYGTITAGDRVPHIPCPVCTQDAPKVPSSPLQAHFYGNPDGYDKPSPTKRFNTKTVSQKEGNRYSGG